MDAAEVNKERRGDNKKKRREREIHTVERMSIIFCSPVIITADLNHLCFAIPFLDSLFTMNTNEKLSE